jgi:hypothetical protein
MIMIRKHESKIPLGRPRHRCEDHTNVDRPIKEIRRGGMKLTHLAQGRVHYRAYISAVMKHGFPRRVDWFIKHVGLTAGQEELCSMGLD